MRRNSIIIFILLYFVSLATSLSAEVERFEFKSGNNPDYLPYHLDVFSPFETSELSFPTAHMIKVLMPALNITDTTYFARLNNPSVIRGSNSWLSNLASPSYAKADDKQVKCIVEDWKTIHDSTTGEDLVVGVGFQDSSIVLFKCFIQNDTIIEYMTIFSNTNSSRPKGYTKICLIEDYDYDNNLEIFINLNFNDTTRSLVCIDIEKWDIEWQKDVASPINQFNFFSCNNKQNPSIIFTTINPGNGKTDDNFNDFYSYLVIINNFGEILLKNKVGNYFYRTPQLSADKINNTFFMSYIENIDELDKDTTVAPNRFISKLDNNGSILKSIPIQASVAFLELSSIGNDNVKSLFVNLDSKYYKIFDTGLNLIGYSDSISEYMELIGSLKIANEPDSIYVFSDGLYNNNFEKRLNFPFIITSYETFRFDTLGNTIEILINARNKSYIGKIKKKSTLKLLTVFYHNNQIYFLMLLSGFFVGLIVISAYQRKTKNNLNLISTQKSELETTHQKLKDTQQKLIEAEKYKQAKDIAGGFAHEIRNALFPVDGSLNKLFKINNVEQYDADKFDSYYNKIKKSTNRAIGMTDLISQYTKLDSQFIPEAVNISKIINEVIDANQSRIDEQHIDVKIEGDTNILVKSNTQQLFIVLNNLLLNSLDALTKRENCLIFIKWWTDNNDLHLTFKDNGAGISSENSDKIFNTFFSSKPTKGTGIGLSMVKKIVEMYNGTISVSSEEHVNTKFEIIFKLSTT